MHVDQGDLYGVKGALNVVRHARLRRAGVRAPVVVRKRGNARGAKGAQEGGCVKDRTAEDPPAGVSRKRETKQAGEGLNTGCAEPVVWTERMLTALIKGVKGGKWFSLADHQRWPNAFFAEHGLFSLTAAHAAACQSARER